jgi:hypothetical protein
MLHEINDKNPITPYEQFAGEQYVIRIKKYDQAPFILFLVSSDPIACMHIEQGSTRIPVSLASTNILHHTT